MLESRQLLSALPLISEFMASNHSTLTDATGAYSDWLEVYNPDSQQAIDLTGWKLQRGNNTWDFPSMSLGPGEFRIIFADSQSGYNDPNGELHASFNLSKDGSSLRLIDNTGQYVSDYYNPYPAQQRDVSFGVGQQVTETKLVAAGANVRYYIPTNGSLGQSWTTPNFADSAWATGTTGLGFAQSVPGFAVWNYKSGNTGTIGSLATAQSIVDNPAYHSWVQTETAATINYLNTGSAGHFVYDRTFPGLNLGAQQNNWVTTATGKIHIASPGTYTFGVNSDDGFKLSFPGLSFSSVAGTGTTLAGGAMQYDGGRGSADSLGVIAFPAAGDYDVNLLYFQGSGNAELEMFAAPGSFTSWGATSAWRLVGDTANGGLGVRSYPFTGPANSVAGKVKTDIRSAMQAALTTVQQQSGDPAADTSLYARIAFDAPNLAALQTLTLKMAYNDGYVVYLNGVQVTSKNAPGTVAWNSQALAERGSDVQSSTFENIDITAYLNPATPGHLLATGNVLAVQLLNASAGDADMLLLPEISQIVSTQSGTHFFSPATPAAANSSEFWEKLPDPVFSDQHGMYSQSFPLTLSTATQTITKLTRKNSMATATVANHGFVAGDVVRIAGAVPVQYNGDFVISNVTQNTFDYTVAGAPASPASGKMTAQRLDKLYYTVDASDPWTDPIVRTASGVSLAGTTVTFTSNYHGFANGDKVLVSGAVQPEYNGLFTIGGVTTNTFNYTISGAPAAATGTIIAQHVDRVVTSLAASGTTVTATVAGHGLANGDLVRIAGASPAEYNGDFIIANVTTNTFTYTLAAAPPVSSATGGIAAFKLGTQYTGPITISTTTTVRAVAYNSNGYLPSNVVTQTYVFPGDVIQQPANPPGFPGSWDTWPADYQMDPRITTDPAYRNTLVDALKSLPSMSIVSDKTNLFDPANGIYANQSISLNGNYNGIPMQVPGSLEYFAADGSNDFQINAGVQIYGGVGRSPQYKKHSFRLVFKSEYGASKLDFPLFGDGAATSFDTLTLRAQFNDAWTWAGSVVQFVRDAFAPDLQIAMGDPSHRSTFVNLYVDGLYWGVYQATERPDANFSASYLGGTGDDWESNNAGFSNGVTNELPAWNDLMAKTSSGLVATAYQAGTPGFNTTLYAAGASATAGFTSTVYRANVALTTIASAESAIATPSQQTSVTSGTTSTLNFLNTGTDGHFTTGNNNFPGMTTTEVDNFVVETTSAITIPTTGNWTFGISSNDGFKLTLTNGLDTYIFNNDGTKSSPADKFTTFNITTAGSYRMRLVYFQNTGGAELEAFAASGSYTTYGATNTWRLLGDTAGGGLAAYQFAPLTTLANAESIIATPALQAWTRTQVVSTLNYLNVGGDGHYTSGNLTFPSAVSGTPMESFVLKADSTISIPSTGTWTFGVSSDDGFHLQLFDGATTVLDMSSDGLRTAADTFASVNITKAGSYTLRLVYFQSTTPASELELYAAKGSFTAWSGTTAWQLVGSNVTATTNPGVLSLARVMPVTSLTDAETVINPATKSLAALSAKTTVTSVTMNTTTKLVTVTLANHGLVNGETVVMSGADQAAYNGTFVISNVTATTFTYTASATAATPATGTISEQVYGLCRTGSTVTINLPGHGFANGDYVTISGAGQSDYNATFAISNVTANTFTISVLNTPTTPGTGTNIVVRKAVQAWSSSTTAANINYLSTGNDGHFGSNATFPGTIAGNLVENLVLEAKTTVGIPSAGAWTFAVHSDDGFSLTLTDGTNTYTGQYNGVRSPSDTFVTFNLPHSGAYRMRLVYFQNTSGAEVELYAAPGTWTAYSQTSLWRRVGDNAAGGLGTSTYDMMAVTTYQANVPVTSLADAQSVIATPSEQISATTEYRNTVNLLNTGTDGHFSGGAAFPGLASDTPTEVDNFVVQVQSAVTIPSAGTWTFGVTCDDGFSLTLMDGLTPLSPTLSRSGTGATADALQTYTFVHAGTYTLNLLYYQNTGDAGVELYAASGTYSTFDPSNFRLVGDTVNGGLAVGSGISPVEMYFTLQGENPDGTRNPSYPVLLDMNNYIDYMLMNIFIGNTDWPGHNFYAARLNGPNSTGYKFYDWDAEWSVGLQSSLTQNVTGVSTVAAKPYYYLLGSPDFRMQFADRVQQFMFNNGALTPAATGALYQSLADEVQWAIALESARWGDVPTSPTPIPHTPAEWRTERDYILNTYLPQRTGIVIGQLQAAGLFPTVAVPTFAVNGVTEYGGTFRPGDTLTASTGTGIIYYCNDGSDPRLPRGALNPSAVRYAAGITLAQNTQVRARVLANGTWSALADVAFYVDLAPSIRITELMYNPPPATPAEAAAGYTDQEFEYVEIENIGASPVPLAGTRFSDGIDFTFPDVTIAPGQYLLVVSNAAAFAMRYPGLVSAVVGQYTGQLANGGERVELDAPVGGMIQAFTYNNNWYGQTDGGGFSLTIRDPLQDGSLWDSSAGWRASAAFGGSPGAGDSLALPGSVVLNEVLIHNGTATDLVELRNTTAQPVDLSGWFLSDSSADLTRYQFATGTIIAAGGFQVLTAARDFGNTGNPACHTAFALSGHGGQLYLSSNSSGLPGGYRDKDDYGASPAGMPIGLYTTPSGSADSTLLQTPTFGPGPDYPGAANSTPWVGPVVLNELMYHPTDPTPAELAAGYADNSEFEFIELYNRSDTARPLSSFLLGNGVGFTFGWYPDNSGSEVATLEQGATATWASSALQNATYTVYAHLTLVDGDGHHRSLDDAAQYTITTAGGPVTVGIDQNQVGVAGNDVWVNLGSYAFAGAGSVQLARGTTSPGNWTIADAVKFTTSGFPDTVVTQPAVDSFATRSGLTTLAPGAYVVVASNSAAFDARYNVAANHIPLAGAYTGHLNNGGETVALYEAGNADPGLVPYYEIDHVKYGNQGDWPTTPDGGGTTLIRIHPAAYGNEPKNWRASAMGGTPGLANIPHDKTAPSVPTQLTAQLAISPATRITLNWTASTDRDSFVDHYVIYRNGTVLDTSTSPNYVDSSVQTATAYSYQVSAVNRDGYESAPSAIVVATLPGIASYSTPDGRLEVTFTEALTVAPATLPGNFAINGIVPASASLANNNTKLILAPQSALVPGNAYTIAMNHLTTLSGRPLGDALQITFTYAPQGSGYILREYWTGITGGNVTDLTGNANYPNNPTGKTYPSSLEAPYNWAQSYGTRMRGYLSPPVTGTYYFWLAADDTAELWLSTDATPANSVKISSVAAATGYRGWTSKSAGITLTAGQRYYIEVLQKQNTGNDNLSVRWQLPDGSWENGDQNAPLPGIRLSPWNGLPDVTPPTVPQNLAGRLVGGNTQIQLSWSASTDPESSVAQYVIYRDGVKYATSNTTSFTDASVSSAARRRYQVSAVNPAGFESATSAPLALTAPGIASITCWSTTSAQVVFTEPMDPATAQQTANYSINNGVAVQAAHLEADGLTVTLTISPAAANTTYTLTPGGLRTRSGSTLPSTPATFALGGAIYREYWSGISSGSAITDLTSSPTYPNNPTGSGYLTQYFESPSNWASNAGERVRGYILPDVSGTYCFWIASDDAGQLSLSTDSSPANAAIIATVAGWTGPRQWNLYASQKSVGINLVAGQRYYIEALMKQGGGSCNLAVAWQRPGDTFNTTSGLPIPAGYLLPYVVPTNVVSMPLSVANNALQTADPTPALGGAVSDLTAAVSVGINGVSYAATNNGDYTWSLSDTAFASPLPDGAYQVMTTAVDSTGKLGFSAGGNDLVIDTIAPSAQVSAVAPDPRNTAVSQLQIVFSEPVTGFSLADLRLTRDGTSDLLADAQSLSTTDNITWTLSGLAAVTADPGSYVLGLKAACSNIQDAAGNPLAADAAVSWTVLSPLIVLDGSTNSAGNSFTVRLNAQGLAEFTRNGTTTTRPLSLFNSVQIIGGPGDDLIQIDLSNGNPLATSGLSISGGGQLLGDSLVIIGTSGNDAFTLTGSQILTGASTFNYTGIETLTLDLGAGDDTADIAGPLAAKLTFKGGSGANTVNVASGSQVFDSDLGAGGSAALTVASGASAVSGVNQHLTSLAIGANGTASVSRGAGVVVQTSSLSIGGSGGSLGTLDLADGSLVLPYSGPAPYAMLRDLVWNGRITGRGIVTSIGNNNNPGAVGIVDNSMLHQTVWNGTAISDGTSFQQMILKGTYAGDANLDGQVTAADYLSIIANMGTFNSPYFLGDLDLDGNITPNDLAIVSQNLGHGSGAGAQLLPASVAPAPRAATSQAARTPIKKKAPPAPPPRPKP
ncbi:MAG: PA14 domain-containing protein, partial [Tepidisphaerales bacterium]